MIRNQQNEAEILIQLQVCDQKPTEWGRVFNPVTGLSSETDRLRPNLYVIQFGFCDRNFYGRYCERELKDSPCGHIPHGSWVKAGCNLCRCFDGHMTCLPRAFDGCGRFLSGPMCKFGVCKPLGCLWMGQERAQAGVGVGVGVERD